MPLRYGIRISYLDGARGRENKRPSSESLFSGEGGIRTRGRVNPGTHLAGEPIQPLWHLPMHELINSPPQRRERDSNPR
jgi:hypothetical protein